MSGQLICEAVNPQCSAPFCEELPILKGMCGLHYGRSRNGTNLTKPLSRRYDEVSRCAVPTCDRRPIAKDLCGVHYQRQARGYELDAPIHGTMRLGACKADGCDKPIQCRGYCSQHYGRYKTGRPIDGAFKESRRYLPTDKCEADGCDSKPKMNGLCYFHGQRRRQGVPFDQPRKGTYRRGNCEVEGCTEPVYAKRRCGLHYGRLHRGYEMDAPKQRENGVWHHMDANGYVLVSVPLGTPGSKAYSSKRSKFGVMLQHRYVMQCHLGRPLLARETVHHKDGNRTNNDIANLELKSGRHGPGVNIIDGIEASLSWLGRYAKVNPTARKLLSKLEAEIANASDAQLELWQHQVVLDEEIAQRAAKRK